MATAQEVQPRIHNPETMSAASPEKKDSTSDLEHQHAENPTTHASNDADRAHYEKYGTYDRYEITEEDCYEELGFSFPNWKKWMILSIIFLVQVSMNFNTSLYSNAVGGIHREFGVSAQAARLGAALFLVFYAFGCELWAPWSEELGRWPVLQLSLFLVNIWQIPVGIAPNFGTILAFRSLGGLSTAGGSVTLAMVADMWEADKQQYAVVSIVSSSTSRSMSNILVGLHRLLVCWRLSPRTHRRWVRRTVPRMAMEHLDTAYLWLCCPNHSCTPRTRDPNNSPHGQDCKKATRRGREEWKASQHLGPQRDTHVQGALQRKGNPDHVDPPLPHVRH